MSNMHHLIVLICFMHYDKYDEHILCCDFGKHDQIRCIWGEKSAQFLFDTLNVGLWHA